MFSTAKISSFVVQTVLALLLISGLVMTTVLIVRGLVDQTASSVTLARDSFWKSEIAIENAAAAQTIIAQMKIAKAENIKAQEEITRLKNQLENLEKQNAELPDVFGSGIDRDRSRLLNQQSIFHNSN